MKRALLFGILLALISLAEVGMADNEVKILDRNNTAIYPREEGSVLSGGTTIATGYTVGSVTTTNSAAVSLSSTPLSTVQVQVIPITTYVWIGGSNVSPGKGLQVASGSVVTFDVDSLSDIYFCGDKTSNIVKFVAVLK